MKKNEGAAVAVEEVAVAAVAGVEDTVVVAAVEGDVSNKDTMRNNAGYHVT